MMRRFRETQHIITSATTAYFQILICNSVAMQHALLIGRDWNRAGRILPGVEEFLNTLPLESLPNEVNRVKDDPLIPPEERRKFAELWTLYCDLKRLVENPRTYSYSKFDELRCRFDRIVENKPATLAHSADNKVARGLIIDADRKLPFVANRGSLHDARGGALRALAQQPDKTSSLVEKNMGSSNDPPVIHSNLFRARLTSTPDPILSSARQAIPGKNDNVATDPIGQNLRNQIAAAKERLAMAEMKRVEQKQLEVERQIDNQQFERWLQGTSPRQEGEELVKRSRTQRIAAQHALQTGNTKLGELLFWDAADGAMRASNIEQTHQSGEVTLRLVIEDYGGRVSLEHDPLVFVHRINKRQFDLWLQKQPPEQAGYALVRRSKKSLNDAKDAFRKGNMQYGEVLLWDAADAATRATGINETQRLGEFAVERVIEAFGALSQREVAPAFPGRD